MPSTPRESYQERIQIPYGLRPEDLRPEPGPHPGFRQSLEDLGGDYEVVELRRIIVSAALLLSRGVEIDAALDTAMIWERG